jgi:hypothetical protein
LPTSPTGGDGRRLVGNVTLKDLADTTLMYFWQGNLSTLPASVPTLGPCDCVRGAGSPTFLNRGGTEFVVGINSFSSEDCSTFGVNLQTSKYLGFVGSDIKL